MGGYLRKTIRGLLWFAAGAIFGIAVQKAHIPGMFARLIGTTFQLSSRSMSTPGFTSVSRLTDIPAEFHGKLSLYVLAGQSNMVGNGPLPPVQQLDSSIFVFGNDYRWRIASEPLDAPDGQVDEVSLDENAKFGPGLAFAISMRQHNPEAVIGLIPCAKGASSIQEWQRNLSDRTLYGACLKRIRAATPMGAVEGLLFFQGEADATAPHVYPDKLLSTSTYATKFSTFIADLRDDVSLPKLPVVFAQIGTHTAPQYFVNWNTIKEHQNTSNIACTAMITTDDLALRDDVHFTTESYQVIGERYAEALVHLLSRPCK